MQINEYQFQVYALASEEVNGECASLNLQISAHEQGVCNKIEQIDMIVRRIGVLEEQVGSHCFLLHWFG